MTFLIAAPATVAVAATELAGIGSTLTAAHAAAAAGTTALLPAAGDEVSAAIASLFSGYARAYQSLNDPSEIFSLADAQQLTAFAQQNNIGELSMWELPRDLTGTLGAVDAVDGSGIAQTPFEFSGIFEQIEAASQP